MSDLERLVQVITEEEQRIETERAGKGSYQEMLRAIWEQSGLEARAERERQLRATGIVDLFEEIVQAGVVTCSTQQGVIPAVVEVVDGEAVLEWGERRWSQTGLVVDRGNFLMYDHELRAKIEGVELLLNGERVGSVPLEEVVGRAIAKAEKGRW
jgi:hypothetical protein